MAHRLRPRRPGFSLLEMLVSIAVVAMLLSLLLPLLIAARDAARSAVCASNLRQLGTAWHMYLEDQDRYPGGLVLADWRYGGAVFSGDERRPSLAADRPINAYLLPSNRDPDSSTSYALLYRCPADAGIYESGGPARARKPSILDGRTCFDYFGTSYRANRYLLDASLSGADSKQRPIAPTEIFVDTSRLLLIADSQWYFDSLDQSDPDRAFEASWHGVPRAGNMLAVDGSVRFIRFDQTSTYELLPRPDLDPN